MRYMSRLIVVVFISKLVVVIVVVLFLFVMIFVDYCHNTLDDINHILLLKFQRRLVVDGINYYTNTYEASASRTPAMSEANSLVRFSTAIVVLSSNFESSFMSTVIAFLFFFCFFFSFH